MTTKEQRLAACPSCKVLDTVTPFRLDTYHGESRGEWAVKCSACGLTLNHKNREKVIAVWEALTTEPTDLPGGEDVREAVEAVRGIIDAMRDDGESNLVDAAKYLETLIKAATQKPAVAQEVVDSFEGLINAVKNMKVPQNTNDVFCQMFFSMGPALIAAEKALRLLGEEKDIG